jgi:hypothetical protein
VRYSIGFAFVVALGVMGSAMGCGDGEDDCGARCLGDRANLRVNLDPGIFGAYEVDLVLDGASGAFTCEGSDYSRTGLPTNQIGIAQTVAGCLGWEFWIKAAPESVEISVTAQDGSWNGSVKESPDYVRVTRCPGGSELCPPFAVVVVEQQ